ncbi:SPOR domain-containing protein [Desulfoplanes sp.]
MATSKNSKKKSPRKKNQKRLDIGGIVKKSLFLVVAMAWAFILGVLVGKGYKPEKAIPEIAKIMPEKQHQTVVSAPKVLAPEELDYYDRLKKKKPEKRQKKSSRPRPSTPKRVEKTVDNTPAPPQVVIKVTPPPKKPDPKPDTTPQKRFAYVYQAAAFRSEIEAFRFRQRIIRLGIPAFVETSSSGWHRVNVRFNGAPIETRQLKAQLKPLGVKKPILRSKKPL